MRFSAVMSYKNIRWYITKNCFQKDIRLLGFVSFFRNGPHFLRFFWLTHRTYLGHHFNVKIRLYDCSALKSYTTVQFSGDELVSLSLNTTSLIQVKAFTYILS